jgi:predicted nucleic acid-binding protein
MTRELFVDTSAWYPLVDRAHADHAHLAALLKARLQDGVTLVTTNLVLAESHALLLRRIGGSVARTFLSAARAAPNTVIFSTADIEAEAEREWIARFTDQRFSLADAVSFTVMTRRSISEALTLDRHFATAGFIVPE